jgi:predicted DNA-binding WGR domain protein
MPTWTRLENWELAEPRFVELAVEGSALVVRTGTCKLGHAAKVKTRALATNAEAIEAHAAMEKAWTKKRFVRERTFDAPLPAAPPPLEKRRARTRAKSRWPAAERARLQRAFFDRLRAMGIDPEKRFEEQVDGSVDDRAGRAARDANARASTCLEVAEAVLRVEFRRTYVGRDLTGEHDPFASDDPQPVPFASFARFYRSPSHVFSIAARASHDASTGRSDGHW